MSCAVVNSLPNLGSKTRFPARTHHEIVQRRVPCPGAESQRKRCQLSEVDLDLCGEWVRGGQGGENRVRPQWRELHTRVLPGPADNPGVGFSGADLLEPLLDRGVDELQLPARRSPGEFGEHALQPVADAVAGA